MFQRPTFRPLPQVSRQLRFFNGGQRHPLSLFFTPSARLSPTIKLQTAPAHKGRQRRSYHGKPRRRASPLTQGIITWGFIGANVLVWWKWQSSGKARRGGGGIWDMPRNFVLSSRNLSEGRWWTLLTHAVSHKEGWHLAGNMISYHAFVSAAFMIGLSPLTVVSVGVSSALFGGVAGLADARRKGEGHRGAVGASALICGLAAFVTCNAPWLRFYIIPIPAPIPLWLLTSGYVAWDVYRSKELDTRVGHAAHVGGTVCGLLAFASRRLLRF